MDCFRGSLLHALYPLQLLVIALSTVAPRQTMQSKLTQCSKVSLSQDLSDICTELEPLKAQLTDCADSKIDKLEGSNCLHCCRVSYNFHRSNNLLPSFTIYFSLFLTSRRSRTISNSCLLCCGDCFCGLGAIGCISLCCNWPMRIYAMAKTWHKHHTHHKHVASGQVRMLSCRSCLLLV